MAHPDTKSAGGGFEKRRRENVGQGCARDRQAMLPFWGSYQAVLPHPPRRHTWCGAGHMHVLDGSKVHRGVVSRFALSCCRLDSADFESTSPETSSCAPMVALRRLFPSTSKTGTKRITPPTLHTCAIHRWFGVGGETERSTVAVVVQNSCMATYLDKMPETLQRGTRGPVPKRTHFMRAVVEGAGQRQRRVV